MAPASKRSLGDTHTTKAARVEAAASQGFIPPPKIEEEAEPDS